MKKNLFLGIIAMLFSTVATAQDRTIARGAVEGELYYNLDWLYFEDDFGIDSIYMALLHITETGKKVEINHYAKEISPDALTGDALPMNINHILADATLGVVYNTDWYMAYADDGKPYSYTRLWFSTDYGKTWVLRDTPENQSAYVVANAEGIIYRGQYTKKDKSFDYGETFIEREDILGLGHESGLEDCEFFLLSGRGFYHSHDCFQNYINLDIEEQYVYGLMADVFRGGLPGEVYITSHFPNNIFKVSFSVDTGYNFRIVYQRPMGYSHAWFMSDRKAGDFYIVTQGGIMVQPPWNWYKKVCVEHYSDYGETLVGTYCHDLPIDYSERNCAGVLDMEAEVVDKNSVFLRWHTPETGTPPTAYRIYRNNELLAEMPQTEYFDENLPDGNYTYYIKALYADGCETLSYNVVTMTVGSEGIVETDNYPSLRVYPNPTSGELIIDCSNGACPIVENVEIFDLMGKRIATVETQCIASLQHPTTTPTTTLNISSFPAGMYFVRITTENGAITRKVVKR